MTWRGWRVRLTLLMIVAAIMATNLIAHAPQAVKAQATGNGRIFGEIINGTIDEPVPEIAVTLQTFAGGTLQPNQNTITDADGRFEFDNVSTDVDVVYAVSTTYFSIAYSTGRISFEEDSVGIDVTLDVFEPTDDQSLVVIRSRGLILTDVEPGRGEVGLLDINILDLSEDRVLVANSEGRTVNLPVPRNASRVTPLPDPSYDLQTATIEGATVYGSEPLLPGESTASLTYTIPYTGDRISVELQSAYATDLFRLLVPRTLTDLDDPLELDAPGFEHVGEEVIGPQTYDVWVQENLAVGDRVRVTYGGLVRSEIQPNTLNKVVPVIVSIAAILIAALVILWIVRERRLSPERPVVLAPQVASSLESHRAELIDQLRALETANEQRLIDPDEYPNYRRYLLEQIRLVNRQMRGQGVDD